MKSIRLRKATLEDAEILLKWKNDSETRKWAMVTHDKIKIEDHIKWLDKHYKEIAIITDGKVDYGNIRINKEEIAIVIDKKYRGYGIAKKVLAKIKTNRIAKIVDGNIASMRLFIGAGFKLVAHKYKNGIGYYELHQ
jgi:RimJ/RimL family protein N-acetyltransferase